MQGAIAWQPGADALPCAQAMFRRAAEYFGEDGEAISAAKAQEPERFFSKLQGFLGALRKAREDRLRVEHCLAADAANGSPASAARPGSGGAAKTGESPRGTPGTPGSSGRPPLPWLKMRSAPEPRGEQDMATPNK
jgi:hypothetical protein